MKATIVLALVFQVGVSSAQPAKSPPMIDVHQHAMAMYFLPDGRPPLIPCPSDEQPCGNPPSRYGSDEAILEGTLEYMKRYNIVRSVVSGRELLDHWLHHASARFVGGPLMVLEEHLRPLDELRQAYAEGRYSVFGEVALQYSGRAPDDLILEPYYAMAEEQDIPVLIHTAGIGARRPRFRSAAGRPLLLEKVLTRYPKLRMYVENAGYPYGDEMTAILYQYPQVYADLSTITWIIPRTAFHDYLKRLVRAGFGKRLMFGSDQMIWPEAIGMAVEAIETAEFLTEEQKRDIFFNNAVRFFQWDREELLNLSWEDHR